MATVLAGLLLSALAPAADAARPGAVRKAAVVRAKQLKTSAGKQGRAGATALANRRARTTAGGMRVVGRRGDPFALLPPARTRRLVVGVMGGAGADTPEPLRRAMGRLGGAIADGGNVVMTGGTPGLPDEVVRGARARGGLAVGISSWTSLAEHQAEGAPTNFDVLQMGGETRTDHVTRADAVIIVGGRYGTLAEVALALQEAKPIGVLLGVPGVGASVSRIVAAAEAAGTKPKAPILYDRSATRLVERLTAAARGAR